MNKSLFNPTVWFVCGFCQKAFSNVSKLKEHKIEHHFENISSIKCIIFEEKLLDHQWIPRDALNPVYEKHLEFPHIKDNQAFSKQKQSQDPNLKSSSTKNPASNSATSLVASSSSQIPENSQKCGGRKRALENSLFALEELPPSPKQSKIDEDHDQDQDQDQDLDQDQVEEKIKIEVNLLEFPGAYDNLILKTEPEAGPDPQSNLQSSPDEFITPNIEEAEIESEPVNENEDDDVHNEDPLNCVQEQTFILEDLVVNDNVNLQYNNVAFDPLTQNLQVIKIKTEINAESSSGSIINPDPNFLLSAQESILPSPSTTTTVRNPSEKFPPPRPVLENSSFICCTCYASFKTKSKLLLHTQSHLKDQSNDKPFKCPHCSLSLKSKRTYDNHLILHGKVTAYKCKYCNKSFLTNWKLDNHLRTHTGDRPFKCSVAQCSMAFSSKTALTSHTRAKHNEELGLFKFFCPIVTCGMSFGLRYLLTRHIQMQHGGVKPYKCEQPGCSKSFVARRSLIKHLSSHMKEHP